MKVSKHCSRKREEKKKGGSVYGQTIKDIAKEKTGIFYIGKGTGIL